MRVLGSDVSTAMLSDCDLYCAKPLLAIHLVAAGNAAHHAWNGNACGRIRLGSGRDEHVRLVQDGEREVLQHRAAADILAA